MAPKMKTKAVLLCELCEAPIMRPEDGFIVFGAICVADPHAEPLVGDKFPDNGTVPVSELSTTAFCRGCFSKKLGLRAVQRAPQPSVVQTASVGVDDGEPLAEGEAPASSTGGPGDPDLGFEVVEPLGKSGTAAAAAPANGRTINVGAVKEIAPGAHVNAGMGVLPKNAANLPVVPGQIGPGSIVRVNKNHPNYGALRGRAAQVERFREKEQDFVFRFAGGQPMLARAAQLDKIG